MISRNPFSTQVLLLRSSHFFSLRKVFLDFESFFFSIASFLFCFCIAVLCGVLLLLCVLLLLLLLCFVVVVVGWLFVCWLVFQIYGIFDGLVGCFVVVVAAFVFVAFTFKIYFLLLLLLKGYKSDRTLPLCAGNDSRLPQQVFH